jgi:hypothetical protein
MNDRPETDLEVAGKMLSKITPREVREVQEKREKENPSLPGFLIKDVIDVTKRPN